MGRSILQVASALLICLPLAGLAGQAAKPAVVPASAPAEDTIGERLFLDTRFAQFFAAHMTEVNQPLATGEPVVAEVQTSSASLPGPFAGESINCRSCHFVTEFLGEAGAGNRTYADFAARSPLPRPLNGFTRTPRNAMQMVGSLEEHNGPLFLHFDGEFVSAIDLIEATLTGRNFGWAPDQYQQAVVHIARVIREDDGTSELAKERTELFSYSQLFLGTDPELPVELRIPATDRLDVKKASDRQLLALVAKCMAVYMAGLRFQQGEAGHFIGSPYDVFMRINGLPDRPGNGESPAHYTQRLRRLVEALHEPKYVDGSNGEFRYHSRPFVFGPVELAGLAVFLRSARANGPDAQHAGNCAACHIPPHFTDFAFHNTGVSQEEYDAVHGPGSFARLPIPSLSERNSHYERYLPQVPSHPTATECFRRAASSSHPEYADLGLWNVYLNPAMLRPQAKLRALLCAHGDCSIDQGLASTIARFKTPSLRDLADSEPYFHNGSQGRLSDAAEFYRRSSLLARQGKLRNPPPEFRAMSFSESDVNALAAFLSSLTEDYDDK